MSRPRFAAWRKSSNSVGAGLTADLSMQDRHGALFPLEF